MIMVVAPHRKKSESGKTSSTEDLQEDIAPTTIE
jgi:hypothetical protein